MEITKEKIIEYAHKYDKRYKGTEDEIIEKEIKKWLESNNCLDREKFIKIGLWKSKRPKKHYENNNDLVIKEITRFSFTVKSEEAKIKSLKVLNGVSWPVASAILHFAFPNRNIYIKDTPRTNEELCKEGSFVAPFEQEVVYDNEIKKDGFVKYLREMLDKSVLGDSLDLIIYADYMKSKFIVLTVDDAPGGGASIVLIFKNRPDKVFYVWIYKYEDNSGYDLRGFTEYDLAKNEAPNIEKTQKLFINQLCDKDFGI